MSARPRLHSRTAQRLESSVHAVPGQIKLSVDIIGETTQP